MINREQALEIIDKRDFFNDRAGRELWNDKSKEIQNEDIRNAHEVEYGESLTAQAEMESFDITLDDLPF